MSETAIEPSKKAILIAGMVIEPAYGGDTETIKFGAWRRISEVIELAEKIDAFAQQTRDAALEEDVTVFNQAVFDTCELVSSGLCAWPLRREGGDCGEPPGQILHTAITAIRKYLAVARALKSTASRDSK